MQGCDAKPEGLSSILRTHAVGEKQLPHVSLWPLSVGAPWHTYILPIYKMNECLKNKQNKTHPDPTQPPAVRILSEILELHSAVARYTIRNLCTAYNMNMVITFRIFL